MSGVLDPDVREPLMCRGTYAFNPAIPFTPGRAA